MSDDLRDLFQRSADEAPPVTISTREISAWGKVLTSTMPAVEDGTERWPSNSTSVRLAPSARRLIDATPAMPLLSEPDELELVELPRTDGRVLTKSAMLAGGSARSSFRPTTLTGVGAS